MTAGRLRSGVYTQPVGARFSYTPARVCVFEELRSDEKNQSLSLMRGPPMAGCTSHRRTILVVFRNPSSINLDVRLFTCRPAVENALYKLPVILFPPSLGMTLVTVPLNWYSAVFPPV